MQGMITTTEAGRRLGGISRQRVQKLIEDGSLPGAERVTTRLTLVPEGEVEALAKRRQEEACRPNRGRRDGRPPKVAVA
jgi:hypothetical protein